MLLLPLPKSREKKSPDVKVVPVSEKLTRMTGIFPVPVEGTTDCG
jgi:hypothetical protein